MTGDQLDQQLTKFPERSSNVLKAKQKCENFEKELQKMSIIWLKKPDTGIEENEIDPISELVRH